MRATIREVAEQAQVSAMTVSNVLRGKAGEASGETRERVLRAARELKYTPVAPPTRQNIHIETRIIGILFDSVDFEDTWGAPIYRGMRNGARQAGYDLLTLLRPATDWRVDQDELRFFNRRSDGFVFVVPQDRRHVLETMCRHQVPVVTCNLESGLPEVPSVVLDDEGAMRQAVEHLIAHGHRAIGFMGQASERSDFRARRCGYEEAMREAGLKTCVVMAKKTTWQEVMREEMRSLLANRQITAMVCAADAYALQVWQLAQELGLQIPRDLSLIGMDDLPESAARGLSSFRFSSEESGRLTIEAVVKLIQGAPPALCSAVLPVELVERNSVAAPPRR